MNYFPLLMNLDYKKVVIVGGGHVARQKAEALLPTKAQVTVISPVVTEKLEQYIHEGLVTWKEKSFEPADLDDAALIFAVTNDEEVNNAVEEAAQHWQLLSRADAKGRIDFINPAVVRRGEFVLTVSTSGASPGLTRKVKSELAEEYGEHYAQYVSFLKEARQRILVKFTGDEKKQLLAELLDPQVLEWVEQGDMQKCEAWLLKRLGEEQ
ncbi:MULTISPECIES: bifunctional precorrin-2 dehydrogenase/sirohydrochlorin ferrochelatase [Cytobacillus]|jgi:precorrin-2 dehydrogenase / sirohydrochlorin ferrochelatase|uniref:precorrin-2 dehydrogenase/sirohydrochlorin ferrochelatase family protein n=1 Tax=Cytobacillus TaxID=2675230 RepID=UPI001C23B0A5|nr:NAD(P)-dependent oxidoreductase [Cytobacillus oceanisediminis]MBY0154225.1 siroheme synthase [Cytobacillus firmus]MBU8732223.1 siroheme synthase [Cytobacillus oceanisediminis]MCM3404611.1 siroheme synthase [Cytobacillus oceanisediminis]MCM3531315.1 siroheme synthase [Cytobacillus oceanisediminis]MDK7666164.1 NAD(P)-dependent oxidoreductase [Cytobacillus oceanisediminis]